MTSLSLGEFVRWPWKHFVLSIAAPAEAEAHRSGLTESDQEDASGDAYTTALITNGHFGARGTSGMAAEREGANDALSAAKRAA